MAQERDGCRTLMLIVWTLYLLAVFALADLVIVVTLFAHREFDATMLTALMVMVMSSVSSIIYISLHLHFAYRFRHGCQPGQTRSKLESITRFLPRILIIFWIAASANGLMVAARQPRCLSATASHDLWRAGLSCTLHRSATGMAVAALVVTCILFCSIEVSYRPFYASYLIICRPRQDSSFGLTPSPSELNCSLSPSSSLSSCENEKVEHDRVLTRHLSDRAFWLQRQNSLSSRNAIYPPCLRRSSDFPSPSHSSLRSVSAPKVSLHRHWPSHRSLRSTSTSASTPSSLPSVSEYNTSDSSTFTPSYSPTRAHSSVSSTSTSTSTLTSSPLSTMRRASQPEVPIMPSRFLSVSSSSSSQASSSQPTRRSSLPYAWSPSLHHTPLSADPAIRALSSNSSVYFNSSNGSNCFNGSTGCPAQSHDNCLEWQDPSPSHLTPIEPARTASMSTSMSMNTSKRFSSQRRTSPQHHQQQQQQQQQQRPTLPRRATGHELLLACSHARFPIAAA